MSKLYQILEHTFGMRINSNSDIIPYIKKLSEAGKFDEPKKVAALAILLDRLGKIEDDIEMERSLQDMVTLDPTNQPSTQAPVPPSASGALADTVIPKELPINGAIDDTSSEEATVSDPIPTPTTPETDTIDASPTVAKFTPENITDPKPESPTTS